MAERPIIFSSAMVRALLAGKKLQTRRIVKSAPADVTEVVPSLLAHRGDLFDFRRDLNNPTAIRCPFGAVGDRLWVREAHALREDVDGKTDPEKAKHYAIYRADHDGDLGMEWHSYGRWRPSIHMPRWASRLTLEITGVRVERLQAITEADAIAEGARRFDHIPDPHPYNQGPRWSMEQPTTTDECLGSAWIAFAILWEKLNGAGAWDANPLVWALTFKPL